MINFGAQDFCEDVVQQPDGKLVVVGTRRPEGNTSGDSDFAVASLNTDGSLDTSFDNDGKLTTGFGGTDMALAQYTPNGALPTCTDCEGWPNGTFFFDAGNNDYAYALDLRDDNRLVAAGCSNQHFAAVQVPTEAPAPEPSRAPPPEPTLAPPPPEPSPAPPPPPEPSPAPAEQPAPSGNCDAAYPDVCIPPPPPDLDCGEISYQNFRVLPPDPHRFDRDRDGIGCEK